MAWLRDGLFLSWGVPVVAERRHTTALSLFCCAYFFLIFFGTELETLGADRSHDDNFMIKRPRCTVRCGVNSSFSYNGPCSVHVNLVQAGFVFIKANVKKWGLAPSVGTLAPPPAYGRALSILSRSVPTLHTSSSAISPPFTPSDLPHLPENCPASACSACSSLLRRCSRLIVQAGTSSTLVSVALSALYPTSNSLRCFSATK